MSILSLADFNGDVPWVKRCLVGADTVIAQGTRLVDQISRAAMRVCALLHPYRHDRGVGGQAS